MNAIAYLSGAIDLAPDLGAGWRQRMGAWLDAAGISAADPLRMQVELTGLDAAALMALRSTDEPRFKHETRRMMEHDLAFVATQATCVIAWIDAHVRMGTYAELTVAFLSGVPIFAIAPDAAAVSGWCATSAEGLFDSEQALQAHFTDMATQGRTGLAPALQQLRAHKQAALQSRGTWPWGASSG